MKRTVTLLLAAGLVLGAAAGSQAVDIKARSLWEFTWELGTPSFERHTGQDIFGARQRLHTQIDVVASESLKDVMFFEIGDQNWDSSKDGASPGTDDKMVKVRYNYVDQVIPQTDAMVRMRLQDFSLSDFVSSSPILGSGPADGTGITLSGQFNENVGASLFWLRAENDNRTDGYGIDETNPYSDAMDFIGLTVPLTFDGVKVTPWAVVGMIGRDSLDTDKDAISQKGGLIPIQADISPDALKDRHNTTWWVGVVSELTYLDPFRIAVDATYGSVDMGSYKTLDGGTIRDFDIKHASWLASILGEYKTGYFTPGILFWYVSGDDSNAYNGSERMPSIEGSWTASSYGFDDNYGRDSSNMIGLTNDGTMGVYLQVKDISFMEDLTHIFRIGSVKGTNSTEMAQYVDTPYAGDYRALSNNNLYLITADKAWEVNFDTQYKIYQDLTLYVELGWINLDLDKKVRGLDSDEYRGNALRDAVTLQYAF